MGGFEKTASALGRSSYLSHNRIDDLTQKH
ncbi:MAG: hypothetical protein ACJAUW_001483, partial [Yoonia sp.]